MSIAGAVFDFFPVPVEGINVTFVLLSAALAIAVSLYIFRNRNLPPGPYGLPWLGYLPFLGSEAHLSLAQLAKRYGDIMSLTMMGKTYIHLNSLDLIREAFISKSENFSGRDQDYNLLNWIDEGKGIAQTEGRVWKEQRHFFLQSIRQFGYGKLSMEGYIHELIENLTRHIKESAGKPVDIHIPLSNATSNVICKMLASLEFNTEDQDFINLAKGLRTLMLFFNSKTILYTGRIAKWFFPYVPGFDEMEAVKDLLHKTVRKLIAQHKVTFDKTNIRDFTDCYLQELQKLKEKKVQDTTFSMDTLQANNVNVLLEGTESVAVTVYLMLKELLKHPHVQEKIQKELDDVIGSERLPSWSDKASLPYTDATLYELNRVAFPFPLGAFHCNIKETTLKGYRIPKRSVIIANMWSLHMDPKLWNEPEKFDPNRFLNAEGKCEKKEGPFMFGLGKRSCPGEPLAVMEIFLFITSVLQKFTLKDPGDNDPGKLNYRFIAIPRS